MKKIILLLTCLVLTGCYNYNEIEKTAIIDAISIDYDNKNYYVTFEIIKNTDPDSLKLEAKHIKGSGKNLVEAFYNTETQIDTNPFFNHLELLIINDNVINNHFNDITDFILRNPKINNKTLLVGTTQNANQLLTHNEEEVTSNLITGLINNNYNNESIKNITFNTIVNNNLSYGIDSVIPLLSISDSNTYEFDGMIPIHHSYHYDNYDVKLFNILNNNCKNIIISNENNAIRLLKAKTKYDFQNNEINVSLNGELASYEKNFNIESFILYLTNELSSFYQLLKKNHDDLLGINQSYYKKSHHKKDIFNIQDFKINVNININKYGLTNEVKNEE